MPVLLLCCSVALTVHSAERSLEADYTTASLNPAGGAVSPENKQVYGPVLHAPKKTMHHLARRRMITNLVSYHEKKHAPVSVETAASDPLTAGARDIVMQSVTENVESTTYFDSHLADAHPHTKQELAQTKVEPVIAVINAPEAAQDDDFIPPPVLVSSSRILQAQESVIASSHKLIGYLDVPSQQGALHEVIPPAVTPNDMQRADDTDEALPPVLTVSTVVAANTPTAPAANLPWLSHVAQPEPLALVLSAPQNTDADAPLPWLAHTARLQAADEETVALRTVAAADSADAATAMSMNAMSLAGAQANSIAVAQAQSSAIIATPDPSALKAASAEVTGVDTHDLSTLAPAAGSLTPQPTMSQAPVTNPQPVAISAPSVTSAPAVPADAPPPRKLSALSRAIVDALPPEPEPRYAVKPRVKITHFQKNPLDDSDEVHSHKSVGISISVHRPKPNINHMLEEAYDALINGNQEDAIALYKQVLDDEPNNKLALFGLATTYHRAGQLKLARPLYGRLLSIDPNNQEGLNNFLVLLADESPREALDEMRRLEQTHPDFSPLPAQMAVIYEKMGDYDQAITQMKHAIDLSPENIKYRYDMAIMLDRRGDWEDAAVYYQQLLTAEERGENIPAKTEEIQERLTFIRSNKPNS